MNVVLGALESSTVVIYEVRYVTTSLSLKSLYERIRALQFTS